MEKVTSADAFKRRKAEAEDAKEWGDAEEMTRRLNAMLPDDLRPSHATVEASIRKARRERIAKRLGER